MDKYGAVQYISTRGLGYVGEVELYTEGDNLYVISELNGRKVSVQWLEEGKSVEPKPVITDKNFW